MKRFQWPYTLIFAVRSLKLFQPFWVKFTFRSWDYDGKYFNLRDKLIKIFSGFNFLLFCKGI